MRGKRIKKTKGAARRWLGVAVCMTVLAAVSAPEVPARERPARKGCPVRAVWETAAAEPYPADGPGGGNGAPEQDGGAEREAAAPDAAQGGAETEAVRLEDGAAQEPEKGALPAPAEPLPDTYFADAVFVGDSRTEGFSLYSGLREGEYLFAVGATVESVFSKPTQKTPGGKVPILDALAGRTCGKIYVMLGVNELGWVYPETFEEQYARVLDRIREDHPTAQIAVESILPVSAAQDEKHSYVNNERIGVYNSLLRELAEEKGCTYLDVASAVADEDGRLPEELTFDGVHLNVSGCRLWLDYLRENPL